MWETTTTPSLTVGIDLVSVHSAPGFNGVNPGVYVDYNGWSAGTYFNSERRQSFWAGYTFQGRLAGPVNWSLTVGAISGYRNPIGPIMPLLVPSISFKDDLFGGRVRVVFIPKFQKGGAAALHLAHEWEF